MKEELGRKIIAEFLRFRPKTYSYLIDNGSDYRKVKGTKKCIIKRRRKFQGYKKCLKNKEVILRSEQRFKGKTRNVFTEKVNRIALGF